MVQLRLKRMQKQTLLHCMDVKVWSTTQVQAIQMMNQELVDVTKGSINVALPVKQGCPAKEVRLLLPD